MPHGLYPIPASHDVPGARQAPDSIESLQIALRYELAVNGLNFSRWYIGGLHSAYVRGQACLRSAGTRKRRASFRRFSIHRGIVGLDPIGALAHVQLGTVFASAGGKGKAKAAYETFLALWEDADPDVPILKRAKTAVGRKTSLIAA